MAVLHRKGVRTLLHVSPLLGTETKAIFVQLKQVLAQHGGNWNSHSAIAGGLNDCTPGHYSHLVDLLIHLLVLLTGLQAPSRQRQFT